jgi:hypothetical protein
MNVTTDEIIVGVYAFKSRSVEHTSYSAAELRAVRSSLEQLLQRLNS